MLPKTIRGWFVVLAWFGLLLMLLLKSNFNMGLGVTPRGPNDEPGYRYFDMHWQLGDRDILRYPVPAPPPPCLPVAPA